MLQGELSTRTSFRDPAGRVVQRGNRVFRIVQPEALPVLASFLGSRTAEHAVSAGRLVPSRFLEATEAAHAVGPLDAGSAVLEHPRVPFPSYPYEWSPALLQEAGRLTLDLALELFDSGFGLKDATPYNVLFRGPSAVFVDVLSIERRDPHDPLWLPYAQFLRNFLLPLLLARHRHLHASVLLAARPDGVEPEEAYRILGPLRSWLPPLSGIVALPVLLGRSQRDDGPVGHPTTRRETDPAKARFVHRAILAGLRKKLERTRTTSPPSRWLAYMQTNSYRQEQFAWKEEFVADSLRETQASSVLDVGCNTGHFSIMAAALGARVVAVDSDPAVLDAVWDRASREGRDVLPLVVDIARPTPAVGWRNEEYPSFLERSRGAFDLVLALAVVHHLLVTARVPLDRIVGLLADLTTRWALVEYVGPKDPMFRSLARGRDALHDGFSEEAFAEAFGKRFDVVRHDPVKGMDRALYLMRKRVSEGQGAGDC